MQKQPSAFAAFVPVILVFVVSSAIPLLFPARLLLWGIDGGILLTGNLILFLATAVSFYFYFRSLQNNNAQVFLRMIYSGMFLKMMVLLISAVIYISAAGKQVNKGAIFGCMFLYLLYTLLEVVSLLKLSKRQRNG